MLDECGMLGRVVNDVVFDSSMNSVATVKFFPNLRIELMGGCLSHTVAHYISKIKRVRFYFSSKMGCVSPS